MAVDPRIEAAEELPADLRPPSLAEIQALRDQRSAFILAAHAAGAPWATAAKALGMNSIHAYRKALQRAKTRYTSTP